MLQSILKIKQSARALTLYVLLLITLTAITGCTGDTYSELHLAAARGQTDQVKVMLDKGMDINDINKHGKTPLMLAAAAGHTDTVLTLIERNALLDAKDIDGMTALIEAAAAGHASTVKVLIDNKADINITNKYGATALTNSVFFGHVEATRTLLSSAVRLNEETTENAFLIAAGLGNPSVMDDLLKYGVDINARGKQGRTALMAAVNFGHIEAVKFLLQKGANLAIRDLDNLNVMDIAEDNGSKEIIELLKNAEKL